MIPLRDLNQSRTTPWVTYVLVTANVAVFLYQLQLQMTRPPEVVQAFINDLGLVPAALLSPTAWGTMQVAAPLTMFTSMFVHADLFHLIGNLLYLWVFGDNVEDAMGHARYLFFYVACGIVAAAAQVLVAPSSGVPMVGASGAIAGVLGAYLILYPAARVLTLVFLLFFIRIMYLPAVVLLGLWFVLQLLSASGGSAAGVAWFAHIGGFLAGVVLVGFLAVKDRRRMQVVRRR